MQQIIQKNKKHMSFFLQEVKLNIFLSHRVIILTGGKGFVFNILGNLQI